MARASRWCGNERLRRVPCFQSRSRGRTWVQAAREVNDERHLCPLQLDVIERAIIMWSNPNNIVLSPFMGIGSEGVTALRLRRKFLGIELKESYFRQASRYLEAQDGQDDLFAREMVA